VDLLAHGLSHEVQFLAEVGQAVGEDVQLDGTAAGAVSAAPLRGGFEHLVQSRHRAEVLRDRLVEHLGELLGPGGGETLVPVDGWCGGAQTEGRAFPMDSVVRSRYG
jgi:hypothetical protein